VIEHLEGSKNRADGPSGWPYDQISYKRPVVRLLATVAVEPYDDLMPALIAAQASNSLVVDILTKLVDQSAADGKDTAVKESQWKVVVGALTYEGRIYIPVVDCLWRKVISLFHEHPESGHFGPPKTTVLVSREFYWPATDSHICTCVCGCKVCHRIKAPWDARQGINMRLETPSQPWEGVTMDFVTDVPESMALGHTGIVIIVD
jgi:hypothetical protein